MPDTSQDLTPHTELIDIPPFQNNTILKNSETQLSNLLNATLLMHSATDTASQRKSYRSACFCYCCAWPRSNVILSLAVLFSSSMVHDSHIGESAPLFISNPQWYFHIASLCPGHICHQLHKSCSTMLFTLSMIFTEIHNAYLGISSEGIENPCLTITLFLKKIMAELYPHMVTMWPTWWPFSPD